MKTKRFISIVMTVVMMLSVVFCAVPTASASSKINGVELLISSDAKKYKPVKYLKQYQPYYFFFRYKNKIYNRYMNENPDVVTIKNCTNKNSNLQEYEYGQRTFVMTKPTNRATIKVSYDCWDKKALDPDGPAAKVLKNRDKVYFSINKKVVKGSTKAVIKGNDIKFSINGKSFNSEDSSRFVFNVNCKAFRWTHYADWDDSVIHLSKKEAKYVKTHKVSYTLYYDYNHMYGPITKGAIKIGSGYISK